MQRTHKTVVYKTIRIMIMPYTANQIQWVGDTAHKSSSRAGFREGEARQSLANLLN